ncbi:MAG: hypothetical protein JRI34_00835 [Deltaproteobacteria bacterium]|nr:hypothetical protein [Deltaproteobacteria bacterium]
MIISFAWTVPALLAGRKTRTRRQWTDEYASRFKKNMIVDAYNRSPRHGGKKVASIRLTANPIKIPIKIMPDEDFEKEGFAYFLENPDQIPRRGLLNYGIRDPWRVFRIWRAAGGDYWIVDFEMVEVFNFD